MSKYDPLGNFLTSQNRQFIPMTFDEIEKILHLSLPDSKQYPAWWSNNPNNNVMTKQWLMAGYETESVDISAEKLVFRKIAKTGGPQTNGPEDELQPKKPYRHPVFGCMAGTVTIADDVDLTEPAMPEWADMIEEKYGKDGPDFT